MKLRERLLAHLRRPQYSPVDEVALARQLDLDKKSRKSLAHELRLLRSAGQIVTVKGDRIALARENAGDDDLLRGKIIFRQGGSAIFIPEATDDADANTDGIQVSPDETGVALHGDRVELRVDAALQRRRDGRGMERTGRVTRVIERARDSVVGHLQRIRQNFYVTPDDPRIIHDIYVPDPATSGLKPVPGKLHSGECPAGGCSGEFIPPRKY